MANPSEQGESRGARIFQARFVALATCLVFVVPVLLDLAFSDPRRVFGYLAADTFYYLTVARNIVERASVSFDGVHPSNGFHPLWQFLLALLMGLCKVLHISEPHMLVVMVLLNVLIIAAGIGWLTKAHADEHQRVSPLFALVPFGAYSLITSWIWLRPASDVNHRDLFVNYRDIFAGGPPVYGTLWTYANGMESSLVVFFYGVIAYLYLQKRPFDTNRGAGLFGLVLVLFTLSRLDHVFIAAPFLGFPFLAGAIARDRLQMRRALLAAAAFAVPLLIYCAVSYVVFGSPVPVSGRIKSSFPHIQYENLTHLGDFLTKPTTVVWWILFRVAQVVVPMFVALVFLLAVVRIGPGRRIRLQDAAGPTAPFLVTSAVGILVLGFYNLLFVRIMAQGHWYFPVSTLWVSLALIWLVDQLGLQRLLVKRPLAFALTLLAVLVVDVSWFVGLHRKLNYHLGYANFYFDEAPKVRAYFGANVPKLLEYDDGIISFATGFPAMSGRGLVLDLEASKMLQSTGDIVPLAVERGFDTIASLYYFNPWGLTKTSSSRSAWRVVSALSMKYEPYDYSVEYVAGTFVMVRVRPVARRP